MATEGLIEVEIIGDSRTVENALRGMFEAFDDDRIGAEFLGAMVNPALTRRVEDRFASEGDNVTGPWQALSPATVAIRGAQYGAGPINVRTGAMKAALTDGEPRIETHSLGATMWLPGSTSTDVAAKIRIAQQGGTTPEGRPVPARPVLGVNETDLELIMVALGHYIANHQDAGERIFEVGA